MTPVAAKGFYDLAKTNTRLSPRRDLYGKHRRSEHYVQIDANAKSGPAPIASRLLRFQ